MTGDQTFADAARDAIWREGWICRLAMVMPSMEAAEELFYRKFEAHRDQPKAYLDEMYDKLQERIIIEGWPFDRPAPKGILSI